MSSSDRGAAPRGSGRGSRRRAPCPVPAYPRQNMFIPETDVPGPGAGIDYAAEGILIADTHGHVTAVNGAFARRTGYGARDVLGKPLRTLNLAATEASAYGALREALARNGCWRGELLIRRKNGETAREQVSVSLARDRSGQPTHYIAVFSDCANEFRKRLSFAAHHDELTALPNRKHLFERLALALDRAAARGQRLGVLFLDLDHFKAVNDTLGFAAGDALLRQVAARLRARAPDEDVLARVGDDEFTLLIEADPDDATLAHAAARVARDLMPPFAVQEASLVLSGSIGISRYPEDGATPQDLLKNAELAMFEAKAQGRNRHAFYAQRLQSDLRERFLLTNDLRGAIDSDALVLHYHPIMDIATGTMGGVEALARWKHPVFGLVPPERFIALAEDAGLISALGTRLLAGACRQLKAFDASGMTGLRMAVNLSALQVRQPDVVSVVRRAIEEAAVDPQRIEIEITESAIMQDTEDSIAVLRAFKALGVGIAIDDFGMGYSSLGYLRHFPADRLKIDKSFIADAVDRREDAAILEAIIALARTLRLKVVAEGVERGEQLEFLRARGAHEAQGFYFSPPLAPETLSQEQARLHEAFARLTAVAGMAEGLLGGGEAP